MDKPDADEDASLEWLIIAAFDNPSAAQEAKETLGEIPSMILPVIGANYGVKTSKIYAGMTSAFDVDTWLLQIFPEDAQKASEIIDGQWPDDFKARVIRPAPPEKLLGPCPNCAAHKVVRHPISTMNLIFCVLFLGIPALFYSPRYECRNCGYHFKASDIKDDQFL